MQNLKLLLVTLLATVGLIAGAAWFFARSTQQLEQQAQVEIPLDELVPADAPQRGATDSARFTIVEFSDFECPACQTMAGYVRALVDAHPAEVRLVFRHFPLLGAHPQAGLAAQAAVAAAQQGKFWEMHDRLFASQTEWSRQSDPQEAWQTMARDLKLDLDRFTADLESETTKNLVERDLRLAESYNLNSTPTFFLNGRRMDFADLRDEIESQL